MPSVANSSLHFLLVRCAVGLQSPGTSKIMEAGMILVTGGTGSSGSEIVEALAGKGVKFRMLARNPGQVGVREEGVEKGGGGALGQPRSLGEALKGVDRVLLLAPPVPNQVELETNVVEAA